MRLTDTAFAKAVVHIVDQDFEAVQPYATELEFRGFETSCSVSAGAFMDWLERNEPQIVIFGKLANSQMLVTLLTHLKRVAPKVRLMLLASAQIRLLDAVALELPSVRPLRQEISPKELASVVRQSIATTSQSLGQDRFCKIPFGQLTPREKQVLDFILKGATSKAAARQLNISPNTVSVHRQKAMDKLGARNIVELMQLTTHWGNNCCE